MIPKSLISLFRFTSVFLLRRQTESDQTVSFFSFGKNNSILCKLFFSILFIAFFFHAQAQDHFPVPKKERIKAIAKILPKEPEGIGHPISDRAFWNKLADTEQAQNVIQKAVQLLDADPLPVNKEQWMAYIEGKTERQNYERPFWQQERRFCTLVLAEALENEGRFIGAIESMLQRMLSLGTWKKPQSSGKVDKDYWYGRKHFVDLAIAQRSFNVATADYWLQDKLNSDLREKLRKHIREDAFDPYLKRLNTPGEEWWWMTAGQNWNTVCHAGVVGAALSITEDRMERATMVAGAETGMDYFMEGFGDYGYCSENVGYWSYGFGHFLVLNEIVRINTQSEIDWLKGEKAARVTLFPSRSEMLNGIYPAFSDENVYGEPAKWMMDFAEQRMGITQSGLSFWRKEKLDDIRDLYYHGMLQIKDFKSGQVNNELFPPEYHSAIRDYFPDGGLLISRPFKRDPRDMAVSMKGGHNGENHNHNDVGSFEVVLAGEKMIIDPGGEVYGRQTFGETRYESEMMNSFGHPVPVVAGQLQSTGKESGATIIDKAFSVPRDLIKYDLTSAYDVHTLQKLTRSFIYTRGETSELTVVDEVAYSQPECFETALVVDTYNQAIENRLSCRWEMTGENQWMIQKGDKAIRIAVSSPGNTIVMEEKPIEAFRMPNGYNPIRLGFSLKEKASSAKIKMKITPVKND